MEITFDISSDAKAKQCAAMFASLQRGPLSTIEAREGLGIAHPGGRAYELRRAGHFITTSIRTVYDVQGRPHKSAVYVLRGVQP